MTPLIALLTDFGDRDGFAGVMKGVIHGILEGPASIVDLSHGIERHNLRHAAWVLASAVPYFPQDSVFCCVVDPRVGHPDQARLLAMWPDRGQFFVAPDNGLLTPVFKQAGQNMQVRRIENSSLFSPASQTFHGRDIYAPTAAHLANALGRRSLDDFLSRIGPLTAEYEVLDWQEACRQETAEGLRITGQVTHVDTFGNLITNIPAGWVSPEQAIEVTIGANEPFPCRLVRSYAEGGGLEAATPFLLPSSGGTIEFSLYQASAAQAANAKAGDSLSLALP